MTKRQAVAQLTTEDTKALADAAEIGLTSWDGWDAKTKKRIKRAVKVLRTIGTGGETK